MKMMTKEELMGKSKEELIEMVMGMCKEGGKCEAGKCDSGKPMGGSCKAGGSCKS